MKLLKKNKGFTLVETIIYIGIIAGMVVAFISFTLTLIDARDKAYAAQEVQSNGRHALAVLTERIKSADSVSVASSTFNTDPGVLALNMHEASKDPTVFDLTADDGILQITEGASSSIPLVSDEVKVTNFKIKNLSPNGKKQNVRINMTIEYNVDSGQVNYAYSQSYQTAITLRQ